MLQCLLPGLAVTPLCSLCLPVCSAKPGSPTVVRAYVERIATGAQLVVVVDAPLALGGPGGEHLVLLSSLCLVCECM